MYFLFLSSFLEIRNGVKNWKKMEMKKKIMHALMVLSDLEALALGAK